MKVREILNIKELNAKVGLIGIQRQDPNFLTHSQVRRNSQ